jgi:mycoredoxin
VLVAADGIATGRPVMAVAAIAGFGILAAVMSPLAFPRSTTAAEAQRRAAADGRPIIYWRPGCSFCLNLRRKLGRHARKAHWVNIWSDPEAAAVVRSLADGNETVPTVVTPDEHQVNPNPTWVLNHLR